MKARPAARVAIGASYAPTGWAVGRAAGARLDDASHCGEAGREIEPEVVEVFEAHRAAQEPWRDPRLDELRVVELAMGGGRRMGDDRVDAAQGRGQLGDREGVDERAATRPATGDLEGKHATADRELAAAQGVLRVAGQPRVADPHDGRLRLEPGGQDRRGGRVALHPDGQRREAAQDEVGRQRRERAAGVDLDLADGRDSLARAGHGAGQDVGVAADELRRRFGHEVGAELDRPAEVRRGERVVDDQQRSVAVGDLRERRDVDDHDRRIRDRLDVQDARRGGRQGGVDRGEIGGVDERRHDPQRPEPVEEQ